MQNLVQNGAEMARMSAIFFSRHCHRTIIFYFSATATCAAFLSLRRKRGGAKSGASAQHCYPLTMLTTHHAHYSPCSPLTVLTTHHAHHSPCLPITMLTTWHSPCSPLTMLTTHPAHYSPCSPVTTHHAHYSPLTMLTNHHAHCSPLTVLTQRLWKRAKN